MSRANCPHHSTSRSYHRLRSALSRVLMLGGITDVQPRCSPVASASRPFQVSGIQYRGTRTGSNPQRRLNSARESSRPEQVDQIVQSLLARRSRTALAMSALLGDLSRCLRLEMICPVMPNRPAFGEHDEAHQSRH